MNKQTRIGLAEDQREALGYALDLAYDVQKNWLHFGDPKLDYGDEWPEVRETKRDTYRAIAQVEQKLFRNVSDRWEKLAEFLEDLTCCECGEKAETLVSCPDGAEICRDCFEQGAH
jgi:hypothetical protein